MENLEEVRSFYKKWYGRFIIVTALALIIAVASIGVNILMFVNYNNVIDSQQELLDKYDDTLNTMTEYDIRVELNITWLDYSFSKVIVPRNGEPKPFYDDNRTIDYWKYFFETTDLDINTSEEPFRWLYIVVSMPIKAYDVFDSINSQWNIEDQTGLFKKAEFHSVGYSNYYMVAELDISSFMWKEIVPQVEIGITLTT